ncbi:Acetylcholine receptor subunit beta-like 2 [Hypsibius exemplaris]|uniref:Acetylcholine receptor subunit beta-like 2 n=1 Tax=Hypsibius exemplaris TaxID=2072580 RepID=A0A9X6RLD0_HYPEX|nr:Acetylcholine receptor subunit beta-like 2 [Hypsibius exemplaris]
MSHVGSVRGSEDDTNLYNFLMQDYSNLTRPVETNQEALQLQLHLQLIQLLSVDEVNQVITTNVIVKQTWNDYKLRWNPKEFGGIEIINIPSERVWLPDIVLYNNADGEYQITKMTKILVYHNGTVFWDPPAIYKSYCSIDVRYFPYDRQNCTMKFTTWTYGALLINLKPSDGYEGYNKIIPIGMDLSEYKPSIEWDILKVSAVRETEIYDYGPWIYITYSMIIRRKTLFYTVNFVIPCVLISSLTIFIFYVPSDSGEKVTLCTSILLSLTVFLLLLAKTIPPTSFAVSLLGRYLLFTLVMSTLSIALTVVVINIHYRRPTTHTMSPQIRRIFLQWLPRLLRIERPPPVTYDQIRGRYCHRKLASIGRSKFKVAVQPQDLLVCGDLLESEARSRESRQLKRTLLEIRYLLEHITLNRKTLNTIRDWKYAALVLDRLFLWIFAITCLIGTATIILDAPPPFETDEPIPRLCVNPDLETIEDRWLCIFRTDDD